jgi:thiol:disulfide interchange protein/DsbC/DsbD-like thiol-disulfide interchange protein
MLLNQLLLEIGMKTVSREISSWILRGVCIVFGMLLLWQRPAVAQQYNGKELVKAELISDVSAIEPGKKFRLGVLYKIEPGWHIYWKYSGDSGIPTKVEWHLPPGFKTHDLQWPLPLRDKEPGDLEVFAYNSEILLFTTVEAPDTLPPGSVSIEAKTNWLVCQSLCVPGSAQLKLDLGSGSSSASNAVQLFDKYSAQVPKPLAKRIQAQFNRSGKNLEISVSGVPNGEALDFYPFPPSDTEVGHVSRNGSKLFLSIESEPKPISQIAGVLVVGSGDKREGYEVSGAAVPSTTRNLTASAGLGALLQALGFALIGGLILNVMPCVLPVISLKIFGFVSEAGERPQKAFWLSMAFALGILVCFAVLAFVVVLVRATGAQVGWGFQFQDDRFVVVISCLVFAFALNLFGVYELSVSARATQGLAKLASGQGYGSAFFQGVFATILATPCTAPFLGTASAFAFAQPSWITFVVFMFVGLGMALPYLVLAIKPKWLRFLPRPGDWMVRFRQFMGFLLIGTLLWLVWILGQMKGADAIVKLGAALLLISILAWIKGSFWAPLSSARSRILAAAAMCIAVLIAAGVYSFVTQPSQLVWQRFTKDSLEKALASGRPVFVDFTADWCLTCKTNERFAIDTPQVRKAFSKQNAILLRADWTKGDPEITEILKDHGRAGVPMYLVYPRGGKEDQPTLLPELITSQTVLDALNKS